MVPQRSLGEGLAKRGTKKMIDHVNAFALTVRDVRK